VHTEHDEIGQDATDIRRYLGELRELLPDRERIQGAGHRKISGSPAPWNSTVGNLLTDIHAGARELADTTDLALGNARQVRGSSDAGTMRALDRVAVNVRRLRSLDQLGVLGELADWTAVRMSSWAVRAREQLDQLRPGEERWAKAPGGLTCPNPAPGGECGRPLYLAPGWHHEPAPPAYCRRCTDENGQPCAWPFSAWHLIVIGAGAA
jgi:hypothetical protein